jgi:hypothetical protein
MSGGKRRVTVTVDRDLLEAGTRAVAEGLADSFSGWVNEALVYRAARDDRLRALSQVIAAYEGEFGEITAEEIAGQRRADREAAVVVRGRGPTPGKRSGRRSRGVA